MIRIASIDPEPIDVLRFLNAARGGGTEVARLPVLAGAVRGLPPSVPGLIVASDLQGIVPDRGESDLLGVAVARLCRSLADDGRIPDRCGVLLAGDLFAVPARRGGYGDVTSVWAAFAGAFPWVAGVAGNHDDVSRIARRPPGGVHLLDGDVVTLDGLTIGGVGGIVGNPGKPGRRDEDEQLTRIELVAEARPDIVVLHEGPPGDRGQDGNPDVAAILDRLRTPFVVCGHVGWREPIAERPHGQVLNLEGRVVVLTPG